MELSGRVVVVTGSSSGIGEAVVRLAAERGARVVVNSARSVEAGRAVAASLPDALYVQGDVASDGAGAALVAATLERFGRLDVLVNNAGVTEVIPHHRLEALSGDLFRRLFDVNVVGAWSVTDAALPALRDSGAGSVVNMASLAGLRQTGSSIPYAVSKAALIHLTTLLAKVTGPLVRVNAVAPGLIDTPWTEDWDALRARVEDAAPLRRTGTPAEVARVTLDLAQADYVTGQTVAVDGGMGLVV
ncbi:MAG: SDR family oxidoreductase [Acidimicrobiales bacterium]|jgi:ketoreductase RED2|nr:SDR family oxidoreductase [Acidimicrobiales bacterium]